MPLMILKELMKSLSDTPVKKDLTFIDNNNINESWLNRGKLHLNRRGSSYDFTKVLCYYLNYTYSC